MNLQEYRIEIDRIDGELTRLFAERMALAEQLATYKKENGLPILDERREREKLAQITSILPAELQDYGAALYQLIFELSRKRQERVWEGEATSKTSF